MKAQILVILCAALGIPAAAVAQQGKTLDQIKTELAEKRRAKLIADCKANRGVDCDSPKAIAEMERANRPLTPEERARNRDPKFKEFCLRNPTLPQCK